MNPWRHMLQALGLIRKPERRVFALDERLTFGVQSLAQRERRPEGEVASKLLAEALFERQAAEAELACWHELTPREQQVTALICLNYTSRQIAERLRISQNTIKTHVSNILRKLDLPNRYALRRMLVQWDFSEWEEGGA